MLARPFVIRNCIRATEAALKKRLWAIKSFGLSPGYPGRNDHADRINPRC
jgi:hypothetical protein